MRAVFLEISNVCANILLIWERKARRILQVICLTDTFG